MSSVAFYLLVILQVYSSVNGFLLVPSRLKQNYTGKVSMTYEGDVGEPVFLSAYINANQIEEGKAASRVGQILPNDQLVSYSGFITVNEELNTNLFFWFCLSEQNPETAPVILWLQGGPGVTSMFALFEENGPYKLEPDGSLTKREHAWTTSFNIIYFDQPAGTGFSFTDSDEGYATNVYDAAGDLYTAMTQFFQLFSEYSNSDFYIAGQSYAGKYVPSLAQIIHEKNSDNSALVNINLKGCLIGNGFMDPENMMVYGDFLYEIGYLDLKTLKVIYDLEDAVRTSIRDEEYQTALENWDQIFVASYALPDFALYNYTSTEEISLVRLDALFANAGIRKSIHVGAIPFAEVNLEVWNHMVLDIMQSVAPLFPELLQNYKILFYSGQLTVVTSYTLTRSFLQHLHFDGATGYYENDFKIWFDAGELEIGIYKTIGNLTDLLMFRAGLLVPKDQPDHALHMVQLFISGKLV